MEMKTEQEYEKTLEWLSGYIDGILENENVEKNQLEKMIIKLTDELELFAPHNELDDCDDLLF
jgi:uncharacterized ubiquitin-like protein YukD